MWGFQSSFRKGVEAALQKSLEVLGLRVEPTVFLIGLSREDGSGYPLCVEPEDGPIVPGDFDGLRDRATDLCHQDPDSKLSITAAWIHEKRQQETMDRAFGTAISEVLEGRLGPGLRFFVALPTPVDQHIVFTAIGLHSGFLTTRRTCRRRWPLTATQSRNRWSEAPSTRSSA